MLINLLAPCGQFCTEKWEYLCRMKITKCQKIIPKTCESKLRLKTHCLLKITSWAPSRVYTSITGIHVSLTWNAVWHWTLPKIYTELKHARWCFLGEICRKTLWLWWNVLGIFTQNRWKKLLRDDKIYGLGEGKKSNSHDPQERQIMQMSHCHNAWNWVLVETENRQEIKKVKIPYGRSRQDSNTSSSDLPNSKGLTFQRQIHTAVTMQACYKLILQYLIASLIDNTPIPASLIFQKRHSW